MPPDAQGALARSPIRAGVQKEGLRIKGFGDVIPAISLVALLRCDDEQYQAVLDSTRTQV